MGRSWFWLAAYRRRMIVMLGAGVILVLVFAGLDWWSEQRFQIQELREKCRTQQLRLQEAECYGRDHPEPEKHLRDLQRQLALVRLQIPGQPEVGAFAAHLEQAAQASGVWMVALRPAPTVVKNGFQATDIELTIRGDYFSLLTFLRKMEETPRQSTVSGIDIRTGAETAQLESRLRLTVYSDRR